MALKPIPRLILIVATVAGAVFGVSKFMPKSAPEGQVAATAQQTPTQSQETRSQAPTSGGDSYQSVVDTGVVRVSVQSPSKPFFYLDRGSPMGFNVEFMKMLFSQGEFAKRGNIRVDTVPVDTYEEVPAALLKNDSRGRPMVDMAIDGLTFNDQDLDGVVYSVPYVEDFGYSLIMPKTSSLRKGEDINGLTIGILKGDPDVKAFVSKTWPRAKLVELSDAAVNGQRNWIDNAFKSGAIDGLVYDYPFAVAEIAGTNLQFAVSKLPGSDIKYKIGVRKGDTQLLENINKAIRKVKISDGYSDLIRKYFTSTNVASVQGAVDGETVYTVKKGDTLSLIAGSVYKDTSKFSMIETRNNLANPNLIQVGQRLVIPKL